MSSWESAISADMLACRNTHHGPVIAEFRSRNPNIRPDRFGALFKGAFIGIPEKGRKGHELWSIVWVSGPSSDGRRILCKVPIIIPLLKPLCRIGCSFGLP